MSTNKKYPDCVPLNPVARISEMGINFKTGGKIPDGGVPSTERNLFPRQAFHKLRVTGTAGTIAILDSDGNFYEIVANILGQYHHAVGVAVVASGVDDQGNAISTTATGIYWYGGV